MFCSEGLLSNVVKVIYLGLLSNRVKVYYLGSDYPEITSGVSVINIHRNSIYNACLQHPVCFSWVTSNSADTSFIAHHASIKPALNFSCSPR